MDVFAEILQPPAWHAHAACRHEDVHLFFPERGQPIEPARAVCDRCPVIFECRRYALDQDASLQGIWAGTSHRQRSQMRRATVSA